MNKYHNQKTTIDNVQFDSVAESHRYLELKILLKAGRITDLELQPRFDIIVKGVNCGFYKADFAYKELSGVRVVEDVKGVRTAVYNLKKKLVKAIHGVEIREVKV